MRRMKLMVLVVLLLLVAPRVLQADPGGCSAAGLWWGGANWYACTEYNDEDYADIEVMNPYDSGFCSEAAFQCEDFCIFAFGGYMSETIACYDIGGTGYYRCYCHWYE